MRSQHEHNSQVTVFTWAQEKNGLYPGLRNLFAVPNAGKRSIAMAKYLKAEGMRTGVPDIVLAWPSGKYHGLFIEMKYGRNKPTPAQRQWLDRLQAAGYKTSVCYSSAEAIEVIEDYLT